MSRYFIFVFLLNGYSIFAQLRGFIYDEDNGDPLVGATIIFNNSHYAVSDSSGFFLLVDDSLIHELKISHLGYEGATISIAGSKRFMKIGLKASPENISEVVISSTEFRQKLNTLASSLSIITHQEIEIDNDLTFAPVFNKQPGVFMQSGTLNTNRLMIRGIGSRNPYATNRVKASFEDIPLTTGEGVTTIEDLDPGSAGRIEITRGPASGIYGAGLGGAINIYTDKHSLNRHFFTLDGSLGSFGMKKTSMNIGLNSGKVYLSGGYHYLQSNGFRKNNEVNRHSFFIFNQYFLKRSTIKLFVYHINMMAYIPSSLDEASFNESPAMAAKNWAEIKGYEKYNKLHAGIALTNRIGSNLLNHTIIFGSLFDQYESRPFNILDDQSVSLGIKSRLTFDREFHDFAFGLEIYRETYKWKIFETNNGDKGMMLGDNAEDRNYYNVFIHYKNELLRNTTIIGDLNLNRIYYGLSSGDFNDSTTISRKHGFSPVISPRLGINYHLQLPLSVFISLNHGFSAPSLDETLNAEGQLNPHIKPESGWSLETGFRGGLMQDRLRFELSLYRMTIKNLLITKRISEDIFTAINAGVTSHKGVEFYGRYRILESEEPEKGNLSLEVTSTISWNKFSEFIDDEIDFGGNKMPGIPSSVINIGLYRQCEQGINLAFTFQRVGSMFLDDGNTGRVGSYNLLNAKIIHKFRFSSKIKSEIFFGINNILDAHYASMILVNAQGTDSNPPRYYYPGMPINFLGGLRLKFRD